MKRLKKFLSASKVNVVVFTLVVSMALLASLGAAQAAMVHLSYEYSPMAQMNEIGITLIENGADISFRDYASGSRDDDPWIVGTGKLMTNMIGEGETLALGKTYPLAYSARNSGVINEYVRANVYRYWIDPNTLDKNGDPVKLQNLSPNLIDLHFLCDQTGYQNGWVMDTMASSSAERTVLYYQRLLHSVDDGGGETITPPFTDTLTISADIAAKVTTKTEVDENGYTTVTTVYDYDGMQFYIRVEVEGVQEHNARDAIRSAWGIYMEDYGIGG